MKLIFLAVCFLCRSGTLYVSAQDGSTLSSTQIGNPLGAASDAQQAQMYGAVQEAPNSYEQGKDSGSSSSNNNDGTAPEGKALTGHTFEYAFAMSHDPTIKNEKGQTVTGKQSPLFTYYRQYHPQPAEYYAPQLQGGQSSEFDKFFQQATQANSGATYKSEVIPISGLDGGSSYSDEKQGSGSPAPTQAYPERGSYGRQSAAPSAGARHPGAYQGNTARRQPVLSSPAAYPAASSSAAYHDDDEYSDEPPRYHSKKGKAKLVKVNVGAQNSEGKPWGTKLHYIYRDPRRPDNYMEVTEMQVSVNKDMVPQEAASEASNMFEAMRFSPSTGYQYPIYDMSANYVPYYGPQGPMGYYGY